MVILDPVLPKEMTLLKLSLVYKVFVQAEKMFTVSLDTDENANYTVIVFKEDTNSKSYNFGAPFQKQTQKSTIQKAMPCGYTHFKKDSYIQTHKN